MTIFQKITNSKDPSVFTLYREGMFYKCYNEDAMVFHQWVKDIKITSKFIKRTGTMVIMNSSGKTQNITEKHWVKVMSRVNDLPEEERYQTSRYSQGNYPYNWSNIENQVFSPYVPAVLRYCNQLKGK